MADQHSLAWRSQLQGQHGIVSRQQALDAGLTEKAITWRLRSGAWQRLHSGVYATFTGALSRQATLWAAVLSAGPGAVLSHQTAAEIHRLTDKPSTRIHISVPEGQNPGRRRDIRGVVIHRSRNLVAEPQPPWQLPRTPVADTVLDLIAAARTTDDAYGWISAAIGRRLTTPALLAKALAARPRMRGRAWVTAALADAADGVHSPLEHRYAHGVERAHGLPRQRHRLPGQPVRAVRVVRGTGRRRGPPGRRPLARHPPRQRQPGAGSADAALRLARRHRAPLPHRRPDRRRPAPPRLDRHPAPLRPHLHRNPADQLAPGGCPPAGLPTAPVTAAPGARC
jgi:Transcriptional regulator, AbiEi antitoxin